MDKIVLELESFEAFEISLSIDKEIRNLNKLIHMANINDQKLIHNKIKRLEKLKERLGVIP